MSRGSIWYLGMGCCRLNTFQSVDFGGLILCQHRHPGAKTSITASRRDKKLIQKRHLVRRFDISIFIVKYLLFSFHLSYIHAYNVSVMFLFPLICGFPW